MDISRGAVLKRLESHEKWIDSVIFSHDGRQLAWFLNFQIFMVKEHIGRPEHHNRWSKITTGATQPSCSCGNLTKLYKTWVLFSFPRNTPSRCRCTYNDLVIPGIIFSRISSNSIHTFFCAFC